MYLFSGTESRYATTPAHFTDLLFRFPQGSAVIVFHLFQLNLKLTLTILSHFLPFDNSFRLIGGIFFFIFTLSLYPAENTAAIVLPVQTVLP